MLLNLASSSTDKPVGQEGTNTPRTLCTSNVHRQPGITAVVQQRHQIGHGKPACEFEVTSQNATGRKHNHSAAECLNAALLYGPANFLMPIFELGPYHRKRLQPAALLQLLHLCADAPAAAGHCRGHSTCPTSQAACLQRSQTADLPRPSKHRCSLSDSGLQCPTWLFN